MWSALFPGQGSQHPGMGKFLWDEFKIAKETFEEASDALSLDVKKLCFDGSESDLALTENTQPVLVLVSTATYLVLKTEFGFIPQTVAGHSVGEYSALVAAHSLTLRDAVKAVRIRGQAMQSAVPVGKGGMTAVLNLDPQQVRELCAWAERETQDSPVSAANINAPGQIVISGKKTLLDWIATNFKPEVLGTTARVKFIPLKVSAPFHCAMMKPAEEKMASVLGDIQFKDARFPVVQNVTAEPVTDAGELRANLVKQVCAPVRWIECVQKIKSLGVSRSVETGCGKVLHGLVKKIEPEGMTVMNMNSMDDIRAFESAWKG
jgi:[acyl-carrier-protein] S-malonyltransferase